MVKNTLLCVDLKTVTQLDAILKKNVPYSGVLTRDGDDHFLFEEAVRSTRHMRNPKLFDGEFCSLVHMQNGKYQIHMKTITASDVTNVSEIASRICNELINAFNIIDLQ